MDVDAFLPYMRDVTRCEESLRGLNLMWRVIEATAKMTCPDEAHRLLPMMAATREGFQRLEKDLVESLVQQKVNKVMADAGTKARHVIDIIVRNLYERTADVGFLATDHELCEHVAGLGEGRESAQARLRQYRDKYTVYDDILLLGLDGRVLAQIDTQTPVEHSRDPLIAQALDSDTFVEVFRHSDLRPGPRPALLYAKRMLHPQTQQAVGVLCLVFGFDTEMASIFASRHAEHSSANILLLDGEQRVLASADAQWVPLGCRVPIHRGEEAQLCVHGGRKYLVQTCASLGYQGYPGPPGWQAQVMVPLDVAFSGGHGGVLDALDEAVTEGLLSHARSFCPPLHDIITAADTIRRVVWNGQVMTAGEEGDTRRLKNVLEQISETGARTNDVFAQSIRDLYDTVLASTLSDAEFMTHLLVDLLDRNLYERSDDCRWWAMTPELRRGLAQGAPDASTRAQLNRLLDEVNGLYTVYTRLVVYDAQGCIVAASREGRRDAVESSVLGHRIEDDTLAAVLALSSPQHYHVTPFRASGLDEGRQTHVYHAAIRDPHDERRVLGGIGIVFDAEREFAAMLRSGLGSDTRTFAAFVDRSGRVISSTQADCPPGTQMALPAELLSLANGARTSRIVDRDGAYQVLGCSVSQGYREFKVSDGHRDDVLAVILQPLGETRAFRLNERCRQEATLSDEAGPVGAEEFATFFLGSQLFALPAIQVLEALPASDIKPVSVGAMPHRVGMVGRQRAGAKQGYVWVFDLESLWRGEGRTGADAEQVVIVQHEGVEWGLLVGELHGVRTFAPEQLTRVPGLAEGASAMVTRLVRAKQGRVLIQVLDAGALRSALMGQALSEPAPSPLMS